MTAENNPQPADNNQPTANDNTKGPTEAPKTETDAQPWLKSYPEGLDYNAAIIPGTMVEMFDNSVKKYGSRTCLNFMGKKLTYKEVGKMVDSFAVGLQKQGYGKGSTVGVCLPNTPYNIIAYYGAMKAGCTVANFDPTAPADALAQQINDSGTQAIVAINLAGAPPMTLYPNVEKALEISNLKQVIVCDLADTLPGLKGKVVRAVNNAANGKGLLGKIFRKAATDFRNKKKIPETVYVKKDAKHLFMSDLVKTKGKLVASNPKPEDVALLQYTGGTTGVPKGASLTHANLTANIQQAHICFTNGQEPKEQLKALAVIPFFHVFSMTAMMNLSIAMGTEIIIMIKPEIGPMLDLINNEKPQIYAGVPLLYRKILEFLTANETISAYETVAAEDFAKIKAEAKPVKAPFLSVDYGKEGVIITTTGGAEPVKMNPVEKTFAELEALIKSFPLTDGKPDYTPVLAGMTRLKNIEVYKVGENFVVSGKAGKKTVTVKTTGTPTTNQFYSTQYDLSSLKICISGGAPMPETTAEAFKKLTDVEITEGYGLSETSPLATLNPINGKKKLGSIGLPVPGTAIKFAGFDEATAGQTLPQVGSEGEICIKGPQVMKGYHGRPDEDKKVFDSEGFFHTGDIGVMDDEGYITITDRLKDMVIVNGFKAFPKKIEETIRKFEGVAEVIVVGGKNEKSGEAVYAFVQPKPGVTIDNAQLVAFLKEHLKDYEVPRASNIEYRSELPVTKIGKPDKKPLKEELAKRLAEAANKPKPPAPPAA